MYVLILYTIHANLTWTYHHRGGRLYM